MASRVHSIFPRVALGIGPLLVLGAVGAYLRHTQPYEVPAVADIFTVVQGTWAWTTDDSNCVTDPHRIAFTSDHTGMIITLAHPYRWPDGRLDSVAFYDIQTYTRTWIRGAIRGETRLTESGRPVVWDLVLRSRDRYVWHRTDWARGAYTRDIRRCSADSGRGGDRDYP